MRVRILSGVAEVPQAAWDRLVGDASPFVEWAYVRACEVDSATPAHGVEPRHVTVWRGDALAGATPLYLKRDGRGEFIYDFGWATAARRAGVPYLPKLVSMAPFAPFDAPHLLVAPDDPDPAAVRAALVAGVEAQAERDEAQGVHWLFTGDDEAAALAGRGYARRRSLSLVWTNPGDASFEAWLGRLRSKARVRTRRELRRVEEAGVTLERVEGDAVTPDDVDQLRRYYEATCEAHGTGSDYLKPGTWDLLARAWRHRLVLFFARAGGRRVGGSLLVHKGADLYGRYWGADGAWPFLYFALCFYRPIAHALERGLARVHAGAGTTFHKHARGFDPALVSSWHRLRHPALHEAIARAAAAEALEVERLAVALRRAPGA
ncbi:MAG: GNAT family N-acetyltransferase [Planctomycetes bacterium]|nr:GNAT family N-acetyltransferase [Planctomycetota bacterium]